MKLIIEMPDSEYNDLKGLYLLGLETPAYKTFIEKTCVEAIANGTPIDKGDCISREALKKQINATDFDFGDYYDNTEEIRKRICEKIDSATSVSGNTQADLIEYKPLDADFNTQSAVKNLRTAYWSNETAKFAKAFTEAEDIIISAICHNGYTVCKETVEGDLISREQVLKELMAHQYSKDFCIEHGIEYSINSSMVRIIVNGAQAVERPKGEWVYEKDTVNSVFRCSNCGRFYPHDIFVKEDDDRYTRLEREDANRFCWHCGADMRKGGAEE